MIPPFPPNLFNGPRKECRACQSWLPVGMFYRNGTGRRARCKACERLARQMADALRSRDTDMSDGPKNLRDTPFGEQVCPRCHKLIPVDEAGLLETHYLVEIGAPSGIIQKYGVTACKPKTV